MESKLIYGCALCSRRGYNTMWAQDNERIAGIHGKYTVPAEFTDIIDLNVYSGKTKVVFIN